MADRLPRAPEQARPYRVEHGSLNSSGRSQQNNADRLALQQRFRGWLSAAQTLDGQATSEPRLAAISQRRKQWAELATTAVEAIESGKQAPESWSRFGESLIAQSAKPQELVDFVILDPISQLLHAAFSPLLQLN